MNENVIVKDYEIDKPPIQKRGSIINDCIRDCHNKYFHTFDHIFDVDIQLTNITNNELYNFTISDKSMSSYELNKKLTIARGYGFKFNPTKSFRLKIYSNLSHKNTQYYLKLRKPIMHCQFVRKISKNRDYIQKFCNYRRNLFHFACRQWYP